MIVQLQQQLAQKEQLLKQQLIKDRDEEIEMVIQKLGGEAAEQQKEIIQSYERKLEQQRKQATQQLADLKYKQKDEATSLKDIDKRYAEMEQKYNGKKQIVLLGNSLGVCVNFIYRVVDMCLFPALHSKLLTTERAVSDREIALKEAQGTLRMVVR